MRPIAPPVSSLAKSLADATKDAPALLTIAEAAEITRAHRRTITRWIAQGRLKAGKSHAGKAGKVLIPKDQLLALIAGAV